MQTTTTPRGTEYIWKPLTKSEVIAMLDKDGMVKANIAFSFDDLIEGDLEAVNDLACEKLIGSYALQEIGYTLVDVDEGNLVIVEVTGWVDEEDYDYLHD